MEAQSRQAIKRWWSTKRGRTPGVRKRHQRYESRVPLKGRWISLGRFSTEMAAILFAELAARLKQLGLFRKCVSPKRIRHIVTTHAKRQPQAAMYQ